MSLISTLARLEAVEAGRARPLATVRHRHVSDRPLVLVPLTTAGEAGAPLGALVGTDPAEPRLLVVPQPRDRDLRFTFLADLAEEVLPYLDAYADVVEQAERSETDPETGRKVKVAVDLCADAPQLVVPNRAGVEYGRLLGRSTRFRRTAEQDPGDPLPGAPPRGAAAGPVADALRRAGAGARLVAAGGGDGAAEPALGDGPVVAGGPAPGGAAGVDRPSRGGAGRGAAALRAESGRDREGQLLCPPAGPATDPAFDNRLLAPAIERYDRARQALAAAEDGEAADERLGALHRAESEIRRLLLTQMRPTWDAVWRALGLLQGPAAGQRVADRWTRTAGRSPGTGTGCGRASRRSRAGTTR